MASGIIGGMAWSGATARSAQAASISAAAKRAKAKIVNAHRAKVARIAERRRKQRKHRASRQPLKFRRMFRVKATAYCPINTRMEGGRWTATQRDGRSAHGVAVDPRMIPLGTHLWVPGYGHAVADDTGGAIKGHHIDVRLQTRSGMSKWGVRRLNVYVLADPPGKLRFQN